MSIPLTAPIPGRSGATTLADPEVTSKRVPLDSIEPGSLIRVHGAKVQEPFQAIVLQTFSEFGPTSIPALVVALEGGREDETFIIPSQPGYEVTVIVDSSTISGSAPAEGSVKVRTKPLLGEAVQFKGGKQSAANIIRWAIGKAAPRYITATDEEDESIVFGGIDATIARVGDWIVKHQDGTFRVIRELAAEYDVV